MPILLQTSFYPHPMLLVFLMSSVLGGNLGLWGGGRELCFAGGNTFPEMVPGIQALVSVKPMKLTRNRFGMDERKFIIFKLMW